MKITIRIITVLLLLAVWIQIARAGNAYTNAVLADNPLVFYPMDEISGTTALDFAPKALNGTYANVTLGNAAYDAVLGTSAGFNATSSSVSVPAITNSVSRATFEMWVKPNSFSGALNCLYNVDGWSPGWVHLQLNLMSNGGTFQFSINGSTPSDAFVSGFAANQWCYIVAVYDSTAVTNQLMVYKDGVFMGSCSYSTAPLLDLAAAHLGGFNGNSRFYDGLMDGFAIYGTALSAGRIATHYAVGAGIPILIAQQPASATVQAGHSATFTVVAVSTVGAVSYQWQTNGTAILNATNASYTTAPVTALDSGTIFSCVVSAGTNSLASSSATLIVAGSTKTAWDDYSDTWVATDGLGRSLPTYDDVGPVKNNRLVGCFYLQWLVGGTVYDNTQLLTANPTNPAFGPRWAFHFWGKPLFGYYRNDDRYVLRKHAQMLSDIGVDMVYIDISNTYTYDTARQALCQELEKRLSAGQRVLKLAFLPHTDMSNTVQYAYNNFYVPQFYTNLWFNWQGKPLMLAQASDVSPECQSFFTFRYMWNLAGQDNWPLTYAYPQDYGWDANSNVPEELTVRVAESPVANCGRSYVNGVEASPAQQTPALGLQFSQQWSQALSVGAEITCVTGWNEWIAQRFVAGATNDGLPPFLGQQTTNGQTFFVDQYNEEFSRDTEPMSPDEPGSFGDNYYYQFASFIRQLKGARPIPSVCSWPITIAGGTFDDWALVTPEFRDTIGDPAARNNPGYDSSTTYVNQTGRNDLIAAKASADATNVYFYVRTAAALTAPSTNWMLLFIDADGNHTNGWLGYDFVVNRSGLAVTNGLGTTTVERNLGGYAWGSPVTVPLHYAGIELELAIPRSVLGTNTTLDFKWADNILQTGNWSDFTLNGDAAPNDRFNYRAILTTNTYSLVAPGGTWKFNDTGANLGTAWRSSGYDDSAWASGPAILGYGAGYEATTVGYGANANSKYITTYFRQTFTVADASVFTNLTVRLLRVAGAVVYLNGTEIARQNMPAGTISATTLASATVSGTNRWAYYNSQTNAAALLSGTNVLAVEVHLRAVNNTNVSFNLELLGNGGVPFAAVLTTPTDGATLVTNQLTLTAAVSRTATVQFYTNGQPVATVATAPYTATLTGLAPGSYACTAVATDPSGHTASAAASVILTQPQTVLPATTGNAYADAVLADYPLVYYRLNETNGTTAVDASPNARNGTYANVTLGNPTYNPDILGTCAGFNNTNSSVAVPCVQGEDGGNQVSFEMWVKPNSFSGNLNSLYMNDDWWQGWVELQFNLINGVGTFQFTLNGNSPNDVFVAGFATNQWYHLVATYDSTAPNNQLKVYTNGVFMASRSYTAVVPVFLGVAHLGEFFNVNHSPSRLSDGSSRFFDGLMDDFAIYGTVLSASQVQAHFNAGSTVGPASMWLNFNNTLSDQGNDANHHDGMVVGNATFDPAVANTSCGTASEYFPGGGRVQVANPANLNLNTGVPFTLSAWIKPAFSSGKHIIIAKSPTNFSSATHTPALYVTASGNLAYSVAYVGDTTTTATIPNGQWTHVAVTYDGSSYQLYLNGQPAATTVRGSGGANEPLSGSTWQFTLGQSLNTAVSAGDWVGNLDEAAYWPFVLPSAAVNQLFSLGLPPTVIITQSPANITVPSGTTATFTVGASANSGTLAYQWQRNGVTLAGATNFSYTTPVLGTNNSGDQYRCAVSAGSTLATSATATLTVLAAAPSLLPVISGNNLTVSWAGTGYKLQQTSSLSSGAWTDVPGGNVSPVSVTIGAGNQFFRLISQ